MAADSVTKPTLRHWQSSTSGEDDVVEYVLRDFFNVMVSNTDNHGRNSSLLKAADSVRLSPLYDVAPMRFDPEGIVRNTRWDLANDHPPLDLIAEYLVDSGFVTVAYFRQKLEGFAARAVAIESMMLEHGIAKAFVNASREDRQMLLQRIHAYLRSGS